MLDLKPRATGFVPYKILTPELQAEARSLRPKWPAEEFDRVEFFVTFAGHISRRAGHHQLTREAYEAIDEMLERAKQAPSKHDLSGWKPGHSFTIMRG